MCKRDLKTYSFAALCESSTKWENHTVPLQTQGLMFILRAIKPPQMSLSKWPTLLSEYAIEEDRSILFCPSLLGISSIVFLKGCNWTTFLPGTLTPEASPASVEQILARKTKPEKSSGLIVAIAGCAGMKPGVPQSKYTWLPALDDLWPFAFHTESRRHSGAMAWWSRFRPGATEIQDRKWFWSSAFVEVKYYSWAMQYTLQVPCFDISWGKTATLNSLQTSVLLFWVWSR